MEEIENSEAAKEIKEETSPKKLAVLKSARFDQEWVQVLINLRMKHNKLFTRRKNSASDGWKLVYEELKASGAPDFITITKIKKKWMNLMTRFRQIKSSTLSPDKITWPYYDHMNRVFGNASPVLDDFERKTDMPNNDEKQSFIKKLIDLRLNHRHLFTGRKYTARDGWIIIRSILKCEDKYSVEQLSKCWQNLVQRYKQLSKSESGITWPYYELMENWYKEENKTLNESVKTENASTNIEEGEESNLDKTKSDIDINAITNSLVQDDILLQLNDLKAILERQHNEVVSHLECIENYLKSNTNVS